MERSIDQGLLDLLVPPDLRDLPVFLATLDLLVQQGPRVTQGQLAPRESPAIPVQPAPRESPAIPVQLDPWDQPARLGQQVQRELQDHLDLLVQQALRELSERLGLRERPELLEPSALLGLLVLLGQMAPSSEPLSSTLTPTAE